VKRVVLSLLAAGALATPARGEELFFDNYCVTGSFQVCASVRLFSDGDVLRMRVWNLEGTLGVSNTMTAIGLYQTGSPWAGTVNSYSVDYNGLDITSKWSPKGANDIANLGGIGLAIQEGTSGNAGIIGCVDPGGSPDKWATCNSFAAQPYVQFTFNLSQNLDLANTELRWHSQQLPDGSSIKCDTGGAAEFDCDSTTTTTETTTTPEPVTMVLLGSGLAGVGAAARRRRKTPFVTESDD
jgi:hypothetical protein